MVLTELWNFERIWKVDYFDFGYVQFEETFKRPGGDPQPAVKFLDLMPGSRRVHKTKI